MLDIIYEDNQVIVVIKPQNVPTQSDASGDKDLLSMVKDYIKEKYNKPGEAFVALVHRLDRPTGGVIVFARNSKSASRISAQIQNGTFEKTYYAVVKGEPRFAKAHLVNYLKKDLKENRVRIVPLSEPDAKRAELEYEVLETVNQLSLIKIKLETGRPHQIRVQLANIGTPVFGDAKYGKEAGINKKIFSSDMGEVNAKETPNKEAPNNQVTENSETEKTNNQNENKNQMGNEFVNDNLTSGYVQSNLTTNLALWATELLFKHPTQDKTLKFKVYPFEDKSPWNLFNLQKYI
ncbi:MAG: pseudouridine synthase [Clostridia bacterium]|nr:pseudouridine synthase [Clostridia bacterium]